LASKYCQNVVPLKVTLVPVFSFDKSMVLLPGTVMPSSMMLVQAAVAAGMAVYSVIWHASTDVVAPGVAVT
jgi:hypothetical protein